MIQSQLIWNSLLCLPIDTIFKAIKYDVYLLDNELRPIIPTRDNYESTKKLFLEWGFRE